MPANYPYIQVPFATSGDKDNIPVQTDPSGAISWTQGYGPDYQRDLETDPLAKPIERGGMNRLFYAISAAVKGWQDNNAPDWVPASETGGIQNPYGLGVWVRYTSGGTTSLYVSLEANNTETPGTGTKWAAAPYRVASPAEMSAGAGAYPATVSQVRTLISTYAPVPPNASTSNRGIVQLSGSLTDAENLTMAATPYAVARKFGTALAPLGNTNLNTLTGVDSRGVYWQSDDSLATTGNNYPAGATAGTLLVVGDIGGGSPLQTYIASSGRMWTRRGASAPWVSVSDSYGLPIAASDYNAISQNGQYSFGAGAANRPSGFGASWAIHFVSGGSGGTLAFDIASGRMAYRSVLPGGYGSWIVVWNAVSFDPVRECGSQIRKLRVSASGTNSLMAVTAEVIPMSNSDGRQFTARNVSFTVDITTVGANGRDFAGPLVNNTPYYLYCISDGSFVAGMISPNSSAPSLPAGYWWRRIGAIVHASASRPWGFEQYGDTVGLKVNAASTLTSLPILGSGSAGSPGGTTATWVPITPLIPATVGVISLLATITTSTAVGVVAAAPSTAYAGYANNTNPPPMVYSQNAGITTSFARAEMVLEGPSIYWASSNGNGLLQMTGWRDNL